MGKPATFTESLACAQHAARVLLHTTLFHIDKQLRPHYFDFAPVPKPIAASFDELFFGGQLFSCPYPGGYELRTAFDLYFTAVELGNNEGFLLVGPYLPEDGTVESLDSILVRNKIPLASRDAYQSYFLQQPVLTRVQIQSVLDMFCYPRYGWRIGEIHSGEPAEDLPAPCPVFEEDSLQVKADMLEERYRYERQLLQLVAKGDSSFLHLFQAIDMNRIPDKLRNDKNYLLVFNTLLRKTVEAAEVHPYYIDQISAKWAVLIEQTNTLQGVSDVMHEIGLDYCRLVQRYSLAHYTPTVRTMLNMVRFNFTDPSLTLQGIAEHMGATPSHLSRCFNKEVGKSLPEYITAQRMELACSLLRRTPELSVAQVAAAAGFADTNYFAKVFRRQTGLTPTAYRTQAGQ